MKAQRWQRSERMAVVDIEGDDGEERDNDERTWWEDGVSRRLPMLETVVEWALATNWMLARRWRHPWDFRCGFTRL